jgi:hypothetical protein
VGVARDEKCGPNHSDDHGSRERKIAARLRHLQALGLSATIEEAA